MTSVIRVEKRSCYAKIVAGDSCDRAGILACCTETSDRWAGILALNTEASERWASLQTLHHLTSGNVLNCRSTEQSTRHTFGRPAPIFFPIFFPYAGLPSPGPKCRGELSPECAVLLVAVEAPSRPDAQTAVEMPPNDANC